MGRPKDTFDLHPTSLGYWNFAVAYTSCIHQLLKQIWLDNLSSCLEDSITNKNLIYRRRQSQYLPTPFKKRMDKKNQIKISPNDQPDYPVNSVINLLTCTTLTKCCTAINAAVNNNDNSKIV